MNLSTSEAKIVAMVVIGAGSFFIGLLPSYFTNRRAQPKLLLSLLLCLGAGVLLATALLHMLPEARAFLPLHAELVLCSGYLLLYMVDEIVHFFWGKAIDPPPELHSHRLGTSLEGDLAHNSSHSHASLTHGYGHSHTGIGSPSERHQPFHDLRVGSQASSTRSIGRASPLFTQDETYCEPNLKSRIACVPDRSHSCYGSIPEVHPSAPNVPASCCKEEGTLLCHGTHTEPCANTKTGLAGLLMALTLHAILEGLAVGLQTKISKVVLLGVAVASHKFVVGFCLGIELATSANSFLRHAIAIAVFAGGSSAGIGIGMMVTQVEDDWVTNILMPVLQGLAGGSLLYVTVSEILPRERARWHKTTRRGAGVMQFFSVTCGFFLMFILSKYTEAAHAEIDHGKP